MEKKIKAKSKRQRNQYTAKGAEEDAAETYKWILENSTQVPYGCFTCWEPDKVTGFDDTLGGYTRFNFRGGKVTTHKWVWQYHNNWAEPTGDISHLCCNERCTRPSHLADEERRYQRGRESCFGWIQNPFGWECHCSHNPHCMKGVILGGGHLQCSNPDV